MYFFIFLTSVFIKLFILVYTIFMILFTIVYFFYKTINILSLIFFGEYPVFKFTFMFCVLFLLSPNVVLKNYRLY